MRYVTSRRRGARNGGDVVVSCCGDNDGGDENDGHDTLASRRRETRDGGDIVVSCYLASSCSALLTMQSTQLDASVRHLNANDATVVCRALTVTRFGRAVMFPLSQSEGSWKLEAGPSKLEPGNWKLEARCPRQRLVGLVCLV